MSESVPVAPFAEAFKRSHTTANEIAERLGWYRRQRARNGGYYQAADGTRVLRAIGLKEHSHVRASGKIEHYYQATLTYERAVKLCEAIGCDPVDVGV